MNEEEMRDQFEMEHQDLKLARFSRRAHISIAGTYVSAITQRAWEKYQHQMEAQPSSCGHSPERCKC